jgi:hypothetical protein
MPDPNDSILAAHLAAENAHDLYAIMAAFLRGIAATLS